MSPGLELMRDELAKVDEPAASPARLALQKLERYIESRTALTTGHINKNSSEVMRLLQSAERHDAQMLVIACEVLDEEIAELDRLRALAFPH